jgi:hypothetical protein
VTPFCCHFRDALLWYRVQIAALWPSLCFTSAGRFYLLFFALLHLFKLVARSKALKHFCYTDATLLCPVTFHVTVKRPRGGDPSRRCCLVIMREGTPCPLYPGSDFSMLRSLSKHQFRSGGMWREGQGCIRIRAPIPARAPAPAQAPAGRIAPVAAPRGAAAPVEAQAGFHLAR